MWQGDDPVTSASQRAEAVQQRRVTADSFRMLTERLKKPAPTIPDITPQVTSAPVQSPSQVDQNISRRVTEVATPPVIEPMVVAPLLPDPVTSPEIVIEPVVAVEVAPEIVSSVASEPPVREPELARNAWTEQINLPVQPAPVLRPAPPPIVEPSTGQIPQSLVIGADRISSILLRNEPADLSSLKLPPILPPPEPPPPKPPVLPKAAIETLQTDHPIQAHPRRKLAPSDPELDTVMRMIASLPSLEERAAYLEEAALFEQQAAMAPAISQPVEDLEALAMPHVAEYEQNVAAGSGQMESGEVPESPTEAIHASQELMQLESHVSDTPRTVHGIPDLDAEIFVESAEVNVVPVELDETAIVQLDHAALREEPETKKNSSESFSVESSEPFVSPVAEAQAALAAATHTASEPRTSRLRKSSAPVSRPKMQAEMPSSVAELSDSQVEDLARSLLDMMASGVNAGLPQERALAADTLLRIVPKLPLRPLVHMSERMAMMEAPPHMIVAKLLMDSRLEVAGPLLENATSVPDQELFQVIEEGNHQKLRLLARRRKLSRTLTDMLVTVDNNSVLLTLVRNAHAEISRDGFLSLTESAINEPEILAPLCTRADLPAPQAFELFWLAPAQLRRYLLSRFLTDSQTLTKILKITMATQGETLSTENFPEAARVTAALADILNGKSEEASEKLAQMAQIDVQTVRRIIGDSLGEPLVALLKSLGYPRAELDEALLSLQQSDNGTIDPTRERSELSGLFDTLSFNKARILLTYWDWSTQRSGPYAPVH